MNLRINLKIGFLNVNNSKVEKSEHAVTHGMINNML